MFHVYRLKEATVTHEHEQQRNEERLIDRAGPGARVGSFPTLSRAERFARRRALATRRDYRVTPATPE